MDRAARWILTLLIGTVAVAQAIQVFTRYVLQTPLMGLEEATLELRDGAASAVILEEAERLDADAIVLGSHRPSFGDYLIGSTAARVVRHAQCTVVVERSTGADDASA